MKLRTRKILKRHRVKRKTYRKQKAGYNLSVKYDNILVSGQQFQKLQTVKQPSIEFQQTDKIYTIIMWDPDVPPHIQPSFIHWLATNLQSQNDIQNNQVLEYKGPAPPAGTGIHRYYFGLFEQQGHINPQQPERTKFDIKQFINENNLKLISDVFMKVSAI